MTTTKIDATYRVTTPMFCGGADGKRVELRLPSFKGSLRFWWRALAWSRLGGDLESIRKEENWLFGSAEGGQSRVAMKLGKHNVPQPAPGYSLRAGRPGAVYLGYGVMDSGNRKRFYLPDPFEFTVKMRCRDVKGAELESLQNALIALGLLGGMGAKSRKGYGSLALQSLCVSGSEKWNAPNSADALCKRISSLTNENHRNDMPKYTALSKNSRLLIIEDKAHTTKHLDLLNIVGTALKKSIDPVKGRPRAVFGLPRAARGVNKPDVEERRASPLFIHNHQCNSSPVMVVSFLPAQFLGSGGSHGLPGEGELYKPVNRFLDQLKRHSQLRVEEVPI